MTLEAGKYYKSRDGHQWRVLCIDGPNKEKPVIAISYVTEVINSFTIEGRHSLKGEVTNVDLMCEWPKRIEGWINICAPHMTARGIYETKQDANFHALPGRVACIKISVEQGEGL